METPQCPVLEVCVSLQGILYLHQFLNCIQLILFTTTTTFAISLIAFSLFLPSSTTGSRAVSDRTSSGHLWSLEYARGSGQAAREGAQPHGTRPHAQPIDEEAGHTGRISGSRFFQHRYAVAQCHTGLAGLAAG